MAKGSPSMIAVLGLLAVAGFQNRDKLSGLLQGGRGATADRTGDTSGEGGILDSLRNMVGGGGGLSGGFSEILSRFASPAQSAKAQSWVATGPNAAVTPDDLEEALDDQTLAELSLKTGLSRSDLLARLSTVLPDAVDQFTPDGRMPREDEVRDHG